MKILVIHNEYLERGGEDQAVASEIRMLREYGHTVITYFRSNKEISRMGFLGKAAFLLKDIYGNRSSYNDICELARKERPDIAHIHNIFLVLSPSVYRALKESHIPIVHTLHNYRLVCMKGTFYRKGNICESCLGGRFSAGIFNRCWRGSLFLSAVLAGLLHKNSKENTFLGNSDAFIALSGFSRNKFKEAGFPEDKLFIKPNFADFEFGRDKKQGYGLFVGRLVDYKGLDTLLKAYEKLNKHHLKIIGDGPMFNQLKTRVKNSKNVQLLGRLSRKETLGYLAKASFVVFPSECYENMPLAIVESMGCGTPVIASDLGAMRELIDDNVTGLLFRPRDPEDLAGKIRFLTQSQEIIRQMGMNIRKEYESKFTKQNNYAILMDIYNKAITRHKNEKN